MSVKIMGQVWDLELPAAQLIVMLALADHADHNGEHIFPSVELVAWKTGYSESQARRIIKDLTDKKLLSATPRPGKTTLYSIHLENGMKKAPFMGCQNGRGVKMVGVKGEGVAKRNPLQNGRGSIAMKPEPSLNTKDSKKKKEEKEKMGLQDAPDGTPTNGASAKTRVSANKSKTAGKKTAKPREKKTPPPTPAPLPRKRKTELQKWLERAAARRPMVEALLQQFDPAYDPVMFKTLEEYCTIATLEKYVPAAEDLTRVGCQPEDVKEIYAWLKPTYNQRGWIIGLKTISEKYQAWKAHKAKQARPPAASAAKVPPVVQSRPSPEQAAETLAALRALRAKTPA